MDILNIKEATIHFSKDLFSKEILSNPSKFLEITKPFTKRILTVGKMEGINRKNLHFWIKNDLLPYKKNIGWGLYSLLEYAWLKIIIELRELSVGHDKILSLKNYLFHYPDFLEKAPDYISLLPEDQATQFRDKLIRENGNFIIPDQLKQELINEHQFSLFTALVYNIILNKSNGCICIDNNGDVYYFDLNDISRNSNEDFSSFFELLSKNSVIIINLTKIITDLTGTYKEFIQEFSQENFLSEKNINLLKELFKKERIKEVTIRVSDDNKPIISITKEINYKDVEKKVRELNKKGVFRDITLKTRDGKVQYFEQKDLIKL